MVAEAVARRRFNVAHARTDRRMGRYTRVSRKANPDDAEVFAAARLVLEAEAWQHRFWADLRPYVRIDREL